LAIPHHQEEKDALPQSMAVIGVALIAMSEKVGTEMASRSMQHILQYCEIDVKS